MNKSGRKLLFAGISELFLDCTVGVGTLTMGSMTGTARELADKMESRKVGVVCA